MRIKVETHGHQYYSEVVGNVLGWVQNVETFNENNKIKYLQVPAVILKTDKGIDIINLTKDSYYTKIECITG